MSPITHLLSGWAVAVSTQGIGRKERILITLAAVVPDADGLGLVYDVFVGGIGEAPEMWGRFHHVLGHNLGCALFVAAFATLLASRRRMLVAWLSLAAFHLHLFGDLLGAKGPDGYHWPIPYLVPFPQRWEWVWQGQWPLNSWQNLLATVLLLAFAFVHAVRGGISPVELFSPQGNCVVVATLRRRFEGFRDFWA